MFSLQIDRPRIRCDKLMNNKYADSILAYNR